MRLTSVTLLVLLRGNGGKLEFLGLSSLHSSLSMLWVSFSCGEERRWRDVHLSWGPCEEEKRRVKEGKDQTIVDLGHLVLGQCLWMEKNGIKNVGKMRKGGNMTEGKRATSWLESSSPKNEDKHKNVKPTPREVVLLTVLPLGCGMWEERGPVDEGDKKDIGFLQEEL